MKERLLPPTAAAVEEEEVEAAGRDAAAVVALLLLLEFFCNKLMTGDFGIAFVNFRLKLIRKTEASY